MKNNVFCDTWRGKSRHFNVKSISLESEFHRDIKISRTWNFKIFLSSIRVRIFKQILSAKTSPFIIFTFYCKHIRVKIRRIDEIRLWSTLHKMYNCPTISRDRSQLRSRRRIPRFPCIQVSAFLFLSRADFTLCKKSLTSLTGEV